MSTITKNWSIDKIRYIISKLDKKTGLNGAALLIDFKCYGYRLGEYRPTQPKSFGFNRKFINDPNTKEAEVIDLIRHEYAHYYVDVANLEFYIGHSKRAIWHGDDWKWACKMVGADPSSCHNAAVFIDKDWSFSDAISAYNAEDVTAFDIRSFIERWDQVPLDSETAIKTLECIKKYNPNTYYETGDEILHPKKGFGTVVDAIAHNHRTQKIYVRFENGEENTFFAQDIAKIVNGIAKPYTTKRR